MLSPLTRLIRAGKITPKTPTPKGISRGPVGSYGSRPFKGRNSDAGDQKDMAKQIQKLMQTRG